MNGELSGEDGRCQVAGTGEVKIGQHAQIVERFPAWLIEDGLVEHDWDRSAALDCRLGEEQGLAGTPHRFMPAR